MSLVGAIFGDETKSAKPNLSSLFETSTELPAKPHHERQAASAKKKAAPTTKEESTIKKIRKDRKRKHDDDDGIDTPSAEVDPAAVASAEHATDEEVDGDDVEERTIFVGNLPLDTTRKSLASLFKSCGKIQSTRLRSIAAAGVKLPPDHAGDQDLMKKVCANTNKLDASAKTTAQGYVVFVEKESVEKALELNNTLHESHRIRVDHAQPKHDASRSVFVGNLPYHADETSLQELFVKKCGLDHNDVENVRIVRDKDTMKCKGFGYVLFDNKSMVATALQKMHGCLYMKRVLRVTVCGKRFKGRRGQEKEASSDKKQKRSFEGKRASAAVATGAFKRILGKKGAESPPKKKKRARGETKKSAVAPKKGAKKAGLSRRAAAEAKVGKRVKKIEKRVSKGMGKARGKR